MLFYSSFNCPLLFGDHNFVPLHTYIYIIVACMPSFCYLKDKTLQCKDWPLLSKWFKKKTDPILSTLYRCYVSSPSLFHWELDVYEQLLKNFYMYICSICWLCIQYFKISLYIICELPRTCCYTFYAHRNIKESFF